MTQYAMIIDISRCTGCYCCFTACKDEYWGNAFPPYTAAQPRLGQFWLNIKNKERGKYPYVKAAYMPIPCMQCRNAPCVEAAEDNAVYRRDDGKAARLVARPDIYGDIGATMGKFHRKMLEEGLTEEEEKAWREARAAVSRHIMDSDLEDLFEIEPAIDPVPKMACIVTPMVCEACGETVMETRTRHFGGQFLCIPCFEAREKR